MNDQKKCITEHYMKQNRLYDTNVAVEYLNSNLLNNLGREIGRQLRQY